MFQYLVGLAMAVRHESGQAPETLITNQQKAGQVQVEDCLRVLPSGREAPVSHHDTWPLRLHRQGLAVHEKLRDGNGARS
ncbi:MAG: hypothetical protein ACYCX0_03820 [Desulfurivibrionaceae bacterium]